MTIASDNGVVELAQEHAATVSRRWPPLVSVMQSLGESMDATYFDALARRVGAGYLDSLITPRTMDQRWDSLVRTATRRQPLELGELLILEACISESPRAAQLGMPRGSSLLYILQQLWRSIAKALDDQARNIGWRQPLTHTRTLRVMEAYLHCLVASQSVYGPAPRASVMPLARCILRQAEFRSVPLQTLRTLEGALSALPADESVAIARIEILLRIHELTRLIEDLRPAARLAVNLPSSTVRVRRLTSEAFLRLALSSETTPAGRVRFAQRAKSLAESVVEDPTATEAQWIGAQVIRQLSLQSLEGRPVAAPLLALNLPFLIPLALAKVAGNDVKSASSVAVRICEALASDGTRSDHPLVRRVTAQIHSRMAGWESMGPDARRHELETAIKLRDGESHHARLVDAFSQLEQAVDLLSLYRLKPEDSLLYRATQQLLLLHDSSESWPVPLVVLARAVEECPPNMDPGFRELILDLPLERGSSARQYVLDKDSAGLYSLAANTAQSSAEVERIHLGGREGVYKAADYTGALGDTFVFKNTWKFNAGVEKARTDVLRKRLQEGSPMFRVPRTWATCNVLGDPDLESANPRVVAVVQYLEGPSLAEICMSGLTMNRIVWHLSRAARFLAIINSVETGSVHAGASAWGDLRGKDLGRWLKSLMVSDWEQLFEEWFRGVSKAPLVSRRDAHAENWLVTPDSGLVALDFEAKGVRPAGYELAQLTDDFALLPSNDAGWAARLQLVRAYHDELVRGSIRCPYSVLESTYVYSCVARAFRAITNPHADAELRQHGQALLLFIANSEQGRTVGGLAQRLLNVGSNPGALVKQTDRDRDTGMSESRRKRISRAMAYHLRHGHELAELMDSQGWVFVAALSDVLQNFGIRTDKNEIMRVAMDHSDPRFELNGSRIRAKYGHSLAVSPDYALLAEDLTLFHGTSFATLDTVFGSGDQLRPMTRRRLHWSTDPGVPRQGERRRGPTALLGMQSEAAERVFIAGDNIFLTGAVSADLLRIITPLEEFTMRAESSDIAGRAS